MSDRWVVVVRHDGDTYETDVFGDTTGRAFTDEHRAREAAQRFDEAIKTETATTDRHAWYAPIRPGTIEELRDPWLERWPHDDPHLWHRATDPLSLGYDHDATGQPLERTATPAPDSL